MKLIHVLAMTVLWTAASRGDTNINSYGNSGTSRGRSASQDSAQEQNQNKLYKALKDSNSHDHAHDKLGEYGKNYKGSASQYGQGSKKASESGSAAGQEFNKNDATFNEIANQINAASQYTGHQSQSIGKYDKIDDNKAKGYTAANAKKKSYNRGKVFDDNISYGFDKKYSQNLSERGGFEEETGRRKHKLDDYRDKQKGRKLIRGEHSAANARQDAQRALKENKYSQNAAQRQAANGKYGKTDKQLDKAGATQDSQSILYDRKDSKYNEQEHGRQQATNKADQFSGKDNVFGREAKASKAGAQGHADKKYSGGHGNEGDTTGAGAGYKTGRAPNIAGGAHGQGSGGLAKNNYNEHANQLDQGKEHLAQRAGASDAAIKEYNKGKNKEDFAQIKSLNDKRTGKFAQGVHNSDNKGYHDKNSHAAKSIAGGDRKYADASAQSNAKAAKNDLDEQLFDRENFRRHQQDDNENVKKLKRFYHDTKSGGNNFERLKYNRKRVENEFGNTEAAQKEHQNQFDKSHMSAKHNSAQRKDNYAKSNKASRGYDLKNANRASYGKSANKAQNFNKAAQKASGNKKDIAESDYKNRRENIQQRDRGLHDNAAGSSGQSADGYKSESSDSRENRDGSLGRRGVPSGIRKFGLSSAGRGYNSGTQANVGTNSGYGGSNTAYQGQRNSNGYQGNSGSANVGGNNGYRGNSGSRYNQQNNYQGQGQGQGGRRINADNRGGYSNTNNGYSQGQRGTGVIGGLFSSDFGINKGSLFSGGFSNFGHNYASKAGARVSTPRRGSMFTSSFGNSYRKPNTFRSSLGSRSSFAGFKGSLF